MNLWPPQYKEHLLCGTGGRPDYDGVTCWATTDVLHLRDPSKICICASLYARYQWKDHSYNYGYEE